MVLVLLRPADEDAAVAVEPRVTRLDHPVARSPVGVVLLEVDLLTASADVWCEFALCEQVADDGEVVGLVQTEALGIVLARVGALDRDRVERPLQQEVVVAVGTVVVEPDRDSGSIREERALRPPWLCLWDWDRSWNRRAVPSSSLRRPPARTSRCRPLSRSRAGPGARSRGRPLPAPTPESAGGRWRSYTPQSRRVRSTACRCVTPTRLRPLPGAWAARVCGCRAGARGEAAAEARSSSTASPASASHHRGRPGPSPTSYVRSVDRLRASSTGVGILPIGLGPKPGSTDPPSAIKESSSANV